MKKAKPEAVQKAGLEVTLIDQWIAQHYGEPEDMLGKEGLLAQLTKAVVERALERMYRLTNRLDHTATFRTLQEIFQVPLLFAAKTGTNLSDLFKPVIHLSAPSFTKNQSFQFTASGIVPGKTNYFRFTTNLTGPNPVTWQALLTNVLPTNRFNFVDTNANAAPRRFYRVLESY